MTPLPLLVVLLSFFFFLHWLLGGQGIRRGMLLLLLAAIIWGITNPLLKRYSSGMAVSSSSFLEDLRFLVSRPKYMATQLLNLSGSVLFFLGLRHVDVAVGSMVANALAFVITVLVSALVLREGVLRPATLLGCGLVVAGTTLCGIASSSRD